MLITYFDEVKYQKGKQPYEWLAGITVKVTDVREIETEVASLSKKYFGRETLGRDTEFHASALFNGRDHFKSWDFEKRLTILKRLLKIVDQHDRIYKVFVRIDPSNVVVATDYADKAFLYFVERVDLLLRDQKSVGLLIGDHEHDRVTNTAAENLSTFRAYGTPYEFGREITNLIDTVHFSHSHLSRMLQLADAYVWALQLCATSTTATGRREELAKFVRKETNLLQPHRCKWWPTDQSWMLTGNR